MKQDDIFYKIWLSSLFFLSAAKLNQMIKTYETLENLYEEPLRALKLKFGLSDNILNKLNLCKNTDKIKEQMEIIEENNINVVSIYDKEYPNRLMEIYNPPKVLFCKGMSMPVDKPSIAIVGSRKCSSYGKNIAYRLGKIYSELGINIISGLANGIDTEAHKASVENGGFTIAVLGSGINEIYPLCNKNLSKEIQNSGLLLSEFLPDTKPLPLNFPMRNRIISGLSSDIIVVEAGQKSGALITADYGLEQGKTIYAVPGNIDSSLSLGTNSLIKEGATILYSPHVLIEESNEIKEYVLRKLKCFGNKEDKKAVYSHVDNCFGAQKDDNFIINDDFQKKIYNLLSKQMNVYEISQNLQEKYIIVQKALNNMEIYGYIKKGYNNKYFRNL